MEADTENKQFVSLQGDSILVLSPKSRMTKREALVHAAWLVALADVDKEFPEILADVENT